jgi:hypothetical protein
MFRRRYGPISQIFQTIFERLTRRLRIPDRPLRRSTAKWIVCLTAVADSNDVYGQTIETFAHSHQADGPDHEFGMDHALGHPRFGANER